MLDTKTTDFKLQRNLQVYNTNNAKSHTPQKMQYLTNLSSKQRT